MKYHRYADNNASTNNLKGKRIFVHGDNVDFWNVFSCCLLCSFVSNQNKIDNPHYATRALEIISWLCSKWIIKRLCFYNGNLGLMSFVMPGNFSDNSIPTFINILMNETVDNFFNKCHNTIK